ncbi:MAG: PIG-L family deacetylase [Planctomycetota bacterium]
MSTATIRAPWETGRRVLLLSAHPDDEVAGCCAAIDRARAGGIKVFCLHLTTGVPAREVLWPWSRHRHAEYVECRRNEGRAAAAELGLTNVEFLDFPARLLRTVLIDVRAIILETIARLQIDAIWAPAYEGGHVDHDCANGLSASLLDTTPTPSIQVYEYAIYNFNGATINSQSFPFPNGAETELRLSFEEIQSKLKIMAIYCSAQRDLNYINIEQERFRPLAASDYNRPPHPGKLFYQRFQWLFFRHPRIDFTLPEEVCRDLMNFRQALDKQSK